MRAQVGTVAWRPTCHGCRPVAWAPKHFRRDRSCAGTWYYPAMERNIEHERFSADRKKFRGHGSRKRSANSGSSRGWFVRQQSFGPYIYMCVRGKCFGVFSKPLAFLRSGECCWIFSVGHVYVQVVTGESVDAAEEGTWHIRDTIASHSVICRLLVITRGIRLPPQIRHWWIEKRAQHIGSPMNVVQHICSITPNRYNR